MPAWGWVAGGVGVAAVIAVAGVMAFNGLAGGSKEPDAVPSPNVSGSAVPEETAAAAPMVGTGGAVYLFDDSGFSRAPAWSIKEPAGWSKETVKDGMTNYGHSSLQCTFTTYQAALDAPATTGTPGTTGTTGDEATTALVMAPRSKP
ncbi:hypothetical protein [Arthrobacter sp. Soil762]|uniref:hypothetical protein n=1 Tax=Arthrobacter sp. Soil762 TaxID=1736401 RepID=UPI0006F3AE9C|nr:hypothetical protein [Arthrobacter sp. Soil762]KRE74490.1 hypothetical protein ASG77_07245 [Arthrobacter sp. Soil762]